jgi:hypothetical protein
MVRVKKHKPGILRAHNQIIQVLPEKAPERSDHASIFGGDDWCLALADVKLVVQAAGNVAGEVCR